MNIKEARFLLSAPELTDCPESDLPEICFGGRSNVGKSSLINAITNRRKLAKTSNVPGKTRAMNYFLIDNTWHLVDLPGYGYAKVSKTEQERWGRALNNYLLNRQQITLVMLLIDIRHEPQPLDLDFMFWLAENQIPFAIVLSKSDKVGKNHQQKALLKIKKVQKDMNIDVPVCMVSSEHSTGMDELYELIASFIE